MASIHKNKIILTCLALWLAEFILYAPSTQFDFIKFDDPTVLLAHPNLYNENSFGSSLNEILFNYFPREEPLIIRDITWALDSYIYGFKNPFGYHFGNVAINAVNCVLAFLFLWLLTGKYYFSFGVSVCYGCLAVHVEPVCWIMGRKDMLVAFFMLGGLIAQTIYLDRLEKSKLLYITTVLITAAAMLSKISAFTYFLVLLVHDCYFPFFRGRQLLNGNRDRKTLLFSSLQFMPHFAVTVLIFFWYKGIITEWGVLDRGIESLSKQHLFNWLVFTPIIAVRYLILIVFPFQFSVHYTFPDINTPLTLPLMLLSAGIAVTGIYFAYQLAVLRKDLFYFLISFVILMLPYSNVIYSGIWLANRYVYVSSLFILALVSLFFLDIYKKTPHQFLRWTLAAVGFCFAGVNLFQTYTHQNVWRDNQSLWTYETRLTYPSLSAFASLADSYLDMARIETDDSQKKHYILKADQILNDALLRFEETERQKIYSDLYAVYYLQAVVSDVKNEPLTNQLEYCMKAYEARPKSPRTAKRLSMIYYQMAREAREPSDMQQSAVHSLNFFKEYLKQVNDPITNKTNRLILKNTYLADFPFLKKDIESALRIIEEKLKK